MKKKELQQEMRETEKAILDENQVWINNFLDENYAVPPEPKDAKGSRNKKLKTIWISFGSSIAAISAIIVSLVFLWPIMFPVPSPNPNPDIDPPGKYLAGDQRSTAADLAEVNTDLNGFIFAFDAHYQEDIISRIYDSVSGDTLYYKVDLSNEETFETVLLYIYVNPNYEHVQSSFGLDEAVEIGGFTVAYHKTVSNDDGIYGITYSAVTEYNDIALYLEHEQWSLDENSNFFNFFEQSFQII